MPLTLCQINSIVKILKVTGKEDVQKHIRELGFVPESELHIIQNNNGELIIEVAGSRIALSKNVASKILVK